MRQYRRSHGASSTAGGDTYALRNVGTETATGVRVDLEKMPGIHRQLPAGDVELRSGQAHRFLLKGTSQRPIPPELLVSCDQLPETAVPMPPKR